MMWLIMTLATSLTEIVSPHRDDAPLFSIDGHLSQGEGPSDTHWSRQPLSTEPRDVGALQVRGHTLCEARVSLYTHLGDPYLLRDHEGGGVHWLGDWSH